MLRTVFPREICRQIYNFIILVQGGKISLRMPWSVSGFKISKLVRGVVYKHEIMFFIVSALPNLDRMFLVPTEAPCNYIIDSRPLGVPTQ